MRTVSLVLLLCIFFSCTNETEKTVSDSLEICAYIQKRYKTTDATCTFKSETVHGKTKKNVEVRVGKSELIDHSQSHPELFASDIAFRLYCGMNKSERKKYDLFIISITKNNHATEIHYKNKTLQEVNSNLLWLEGFFRLVNEKEYAFARAQFNTELVDTATVDLQNTFESLSENLGKLKKQELQGFEILESTVNSKTYRVLQATYISFYEKQYTLSKYALLMDEPNQKLVNFVIE